MAALTPPHTTPTQSLALSLPPHYINQFAERVPASAGRQGALHERPRDGAHPRRHLLRTGAWVGGTLVSVCVR